MGMYDTVRCEYPLPDRPEWAIDFQTKDLECMLDDYDITSDGILEKDGEPIDWTGGLTFYDGKWSNEEQKNQGWVEYVALIKHGRVLEVMLVKLEPGTG